MRTNLTLALGVSCLVGFGFAPAGNSDEGGSKMSHKAHKKWEFVLPAERWHDVSGEILLPGGLEFATKTEGPLKLRVDTNADGRLDKDVKGQAGFLTLSAENDEGEKVKYSVRIKNVGAAKWQWATGSSMSGKVAGTVVHVFDQDGNGKYDDYGVDAMAIGSSKSASLLSTVVPVGDKLFNFDIQADGNGAKFSPFEGETGVLSIEKQFSAQGKLSAAVFRSGDMAFQVAGEKKGLTVPVGDYQFVSGKVERGSASCLVRSGKMRPVSVEAGGTTDVEWGETVTGEFDTRTVGKSVTVQPNFAYYGAAGEEYYDFAPRGKGPKIILSDARGKVLKEGRFPVG